MNHVLVDIGSNELVENVKRIDIIDEISHTVGSTSEAAISQEILVVNR